MFQVQEMVFSRRDEGWRFHQKGAEKYESLLLQILPTQDWVSGKLNLKEENKYKNIAYVRMEDEMKKTMKENLNVMNTNEKKINNITLQIK